MTRTLAFLETRTSGDYPEGSNGHVPTTALLGYGKNHEPIYQVAGGAVSDANITAWIPMEYESEAVVRVRSESAIEAIGYKYVMTSKTKSIPRSGATKSHVGTTYVDDDSTNDEVVITARRFNGRISFDQDDLSDANSRMNVRQTKANDWASSYADLFDNSCLGVSADQNLTIDGTTHNYIAPFKSVYYILRNTTDVGLGYTADDNYLTWDDDLTTTTSAGNLYDKLSQAIGKLEQGKFWSKNDTVIIAAPGWREQLRLLKDAQGQPVFINNRDASGGTQNDYLMGYPVYWSRGAKVAGKATDDPTGADLIFIANKRFLARGDRVGDSGSAAPESSFALARPQDDTDDASMKFRVRRAFALTHPRAAVVIQRVTD